MATPRIARSLLLVLAGLSGCVVHGTPTDSKPPSAAAQGPGARGPVIASEADLQAALARENPSLTPAKVASGDWKLEVLAAGPVVVTTAEGAPAVNIPLGAEAAARCILLKADNDPMAGITAALSSIQTDMHGTLQKVVPSPIAVAQEAPVMFVSAVYAAGGQVGLFKFGLHAHPEHPVLCLHAGLGYVQTFQAAATRLFETLERGQPQPAPQLVEVSRITVDGLDWGFSRLTIDKHAGAAWLQDTETTLLVPRSATEFGSEMETSEELIDAKGRLVRGGWAKADGKTLLHKLHLTARDKPGVYDYEGEVAGKPVKGELRSRDARGGVASSLASALRLRGLAGKPAGFDIKQEEYVPEIDPQRLTEARYVRAKGAPEGQLRVISGGRELGATVDAEGRTRDVTFKAGSSTIRIERVFARGKL